MLCSLSRALSLSLSPFLTRAPSRACSLFRVRFLARILVYALSCFHNHTHSFALSRNHAHSPVLSRDDARVHAFSHACRLHRDACYAALWAPLLVGQVWCSVLQCIVVRCSVLQCVAQVCVLCCSASSHFSWSRCVAVRCSALQCVVQICVYAALRAPITCGSGVLQSVAECCRVLQCIAVHCSASQFVAQGCVYAALSASITRGSFVLQCVAVCCSALQCVAVCCIVLQCVAQGCVLCCSVSSH